MRKRCEFCGRFMKLTDEVDMDSENFDEELANACGLSRDDEDFDPFNEPYCRFNYVQYEWECSNCNVHVTHEEGEKFYYNPDENNYTGPKPLTLREQAEQARLAQEAAGQMRLFEVR